MICISLIIYYILKIEYLLQKSGKEISLKILFPELIKDKI